MSHAKFRHALFLIPVLFALGACSGGGNNNNGDSAVEVPEMPDPPTPPTDFTEFVIDLFAGTADDSDPVPVNDVDFSYADQDNPAAYDELLE